MVIPPTELAEAQPREVMIAENWKISAGVAPKVPLSHAAPADKGHSDLGIARHCYCSQW